MVFCEFASGVIGVGLVIAADKFGMGKLYLLSVLFFLVSGMLWKKNIRKEKKK